MFHGKILVDTLAGIVLKKVEQLDSSQDELLLVI